MAKLQTLFICQQCGTTHPKWNGKCEGCGSWNSLVEEISANSSARKLTTSAKTFFSTLDDLSNQLANQSQRLLSGIQEFDRVCGGGLVPGAVILVGGDPGIGKSTLLLQLVACLSKNVPCAYVSGEEALSQLKLRAERLSVNKSAVYIATSTQTTSVIQALEQIPNLGLAVIDSIQTMAIDTIDSAAGSVSQVRASSLEFINSAKKKGYTTILVGHVTKEGTLAGPRVLEHMVDTVLYFEGERNYDYRILRSVKNRFGATNEIGVFAMGDQGLEEIANPSALFLSNHQQAVSGTAIFAAVEGTRPLLLEIQVLIAPSYLPAPRRTAVGWDANRLSMILAVLESRCGLSYANRDIYLNVVGGLKINEPAADLAVAAALISALKNRPTPPGSIYFGEIGLAGEVRPVNHTDVRLKEAEKLGFKAAFCALSSTLAGRNKARGKAKGKTITTKAPISNGGLQVNQLQYLLEIIP